MEQKTVQQVKVLNASFTTTLNKIKAYVGTIPEELYAEAAKCGLTPAGPQIWQYTGMTVVDMDAEFMLDIALPVNGAGTPEKFEIKELPAFKCATTLHMGPWDNLGNAYQQLMGEITQKRLQPTGIFREVYINVDMVDTAENLTEVQAGIL